MINEFLNYIGENKSHNTLQTYRTVLLPFDKWLQSRVGGINHVTTADVGDYLSFKSGWSRNSGIVFLQSLKSFCKYFLTHMPLDAISVEEMRVQMKEQQRLNQIVGYDYPRNLSVNKRPRDRALGLSISELEHFFRIADREDKIVAYLLLYFCLRKDELFEIAYKDILMRVDFKNMKATFRVEKRKIHTTKTLDFDKTTKEVLKMYLKIPVPVDPRAINRRFKRYDKQMGIRVYPHLMRHVAYTYLRRDVGKLYPSQDLSEFLFKQIAGHTGRDVKDIYTDPSQFEGDIKSIMTKHHFLKKVKINW